MNSRGLLASFYYAFSGIFYGFLTERNLKIHLLAAILTISMGCYLKISSIEWALVFFAIFLVIVAEFINTAIELTIDMITKNYHPLAKQAKNLAAGAVLLSAINAVIIGIIVFVPYIKMFIRSVYG